MKFRNSFDLKLNVVSTDLFSYYIIKYSTFVLSVFSGWFERCVVLKIGMRILVVGDTKRLSSKDKPRLQGKRTI